MPVQGKSELVEIATRHKAEVLAEFDKIGTKSLYDATQMQSARRTTAKKKRDEDVKVRGKADMEELDGELDRAKLLQQIAELRYERDDTSAPPGEDRLGEIQKKLTACENSVKALNKALNGRARPKPQAERAKTGKMTLKQKKAAAKVKAAAKAAKKATVVSSSSAKPGGGNATKGAGKGKGKGKGGKGKPKSSGRGGRPTAGNQQAQGRPRPPGQTSQEAQKTKPHTLASAARRRVRRAAERSGQEIPVSSLAEYRRIGPMISEERVRLLFYAEKPITWFFEPNINLGFHHLAMESCSSTSGSCWD
jgi:hypothetical protein